MSNISDDLITHTREKSYHCSLCDKTFTNIGNMWTRIGFLKNSTIIPLYDIWNQNKTLEIDLKCIDFKFIY